MTQNDLDGFTGTDNYWNYNAFYITDGVKYLADQAGAYWLLDVIASYQPQVQKNKMLRDMQFWKLKVVGRQGVVTCIEDEGRKPVVEQKIEFTDFPLPEAEIWVEWGYVPTDAGMTPAFVAMLPSER